MENVLVTGGAGYVGSTLVPMLLEKGYKVSIFDKMLFENNHYSLLSPVQGHSLTQHPNFGEFIKGDTRDERKIKEAVKSKDYVVHLAAIVGAPACNKDKEFAYGTNVNGTKNIINNLSKNQKMIFASTGSVYGKVELMCSEDSPLNPQSIYGTSKLEAERMSLEKGAIAYRFATAFGLAPRLRTDLMPNDFTQKLVNNHALDIFESNARRTFIHVNDIARSYVFGIENFDKMSGEAYNVGNESMNLTKKELATKIGDKVKEKIGTNIRIWNEEGRKDPDQRDYEVSYEKIKSVGRGFTPKISLEEGIEELINFFSLYEVKNPFSNV